MTIEIVLEDPRGQGHVLKDSITDNRYKSSTDLALSLDTSDNRPYSSSDIVVLVERRQGLYASNPLRNFCARYIG